MFSAKTQLQRRGKQTMKHYNHFTQTEAECILKLKKNGLTNSKITKLFGKNRSSLGRLLKRLETQNFGEARKKNGGGVLNRRLFVLRTLCFAREEIMRVISDIRPRNSSLPQARSRY